jgi:hypothetical protein
MGDITANIRGNSVLRVPVPALGVSISYSLALGARQPRNDHRDNIY